MENKFELTKEIIKKMLNEKEMKFTYEEIEALMDSEVEKPEEEMDTELVDMCAEILVKKYCPEVLEEKEIPMYRPWEYMENTEPAAQPKKRVIRFKYVALVAAILAVLVFVVALPAGAKLFDNQASDKIIKFYEDYFSISLNKDEPTTVEENHLINQMILNSLNSLPLPEVLLSDEYERAIGNVKQDSDKEIIFVNVSNNSKGINGTIVITQYKNAEHAMTNGLGNVPDNTYRYFKELIINDNEIIVFGRDGESYINYSYGATNYQIFLDCDFDTMVSIAETINVKG